MKKTPMTVKPGHEILSLIFADSAPLNPYAYVGTSCLGPMGKGGRYRDDILDFIAKMPAANNFDGEKLARELKQMIQQGLIREYKFGREYSEVVYITVLDFQHVTRLTPQELSLRVERVKTIMKNILGADEVSSNGSVVRAWWD